MPNGYLKFTGEFDKLKSMGYEFQKLYAANYMQWHKDGIRIWKHGSDITHSDLDLYKLITFLRTNTEVRTSHNCVSFYKFYSNAEKNEYDYHPMTEENKQKYMDNLTLWGTVKDDTPRDELPPLLSTEIVKVSLLEQLRELNTLGWYELTQYKG